MPYLLRLKPKNPLNMSLSVPGLGYLNDKTLKHVVFKMQLDSLSRGPSSPTHKVSAESEKIVVQYSSKPDLTASLSDELLLRIFSKLPDCQRKSNSLVCKRWLNLHGRLVHSVKLLDWDFLISGRLLSRFPNLTDVNLVAACIDSPRRSGILLTHKLLSVHLDSVLPNGGFIPEENLLPPESIDRGLQVLAQGCPNLRKLVLIAATETGLSSVAEECPTLQELELHRCTDFLLRGISSCKNLQILKLIGTVDGLYNSVISDIGLTFLAHGCKRLVKLELRGCEGSYDGIKAIGQCCPMLEELTLCDHRLDGGWMAALSFCGNLKTLRLQSCKRIDPIPGPAEHLGSLPSLERLHLQRCQLREQQSMKSLFLVCEAVREIVFQDCWGLDNEMFSFANHCRRVKFLSLEGCSLLTTDGLESEILSCNELQRLRVVTCNNIKDSEVTPALSSLFSVLKELKWRPDSQSLLSSGLAGSGVGKKGGKICKRLNHSSTGNSTTQHALEHI
ncbi:hypothetical protein NE237_012721 [Protea cynaroides]|uniref:F-box domain-containing protein n=1 Tax=Protea cynaroides TaxID=273540 RepID=A0A9Q0JZH5_9MAGN|nr:hypothetical protein NE237_012721 [Protea cynaroides]